jgi:glycosyltransferase 2 family protein
MRRRRGHHDLRAVPAGQNAVGEAVKRPTLNGISRLIFAAILVGYTLWKSNPQDVWRICMQASVVPLLIAVLLVLADRALMAYRWFVLLRPLEGGHFPPWSAVLRIFFVSTFVGTFLPASIGGDAVRAYSLSNHRVPIADAMASVFVDRMLGVLSVLIMALAGLVIARDLAANPGVRLALLVTSVACVVAALLIFSNAADAFAELLFAQIPWVRLRNAAGSLIASIRRYAKHHDALGAVLVGSVTVQILRVFQAYYLGVALGIRLPSLTYFAFIPLILLIMFLPITANGIGTGQAAFVWLFSRAGTSGAEAFALSVLFVALGILANLPGALYYLGPAPQPLQSASPD